MLTEQLNANWRDWPDRAKVQMLERLKQRPTPSRALPQAKLNRGIAYQFRGNNARLQTCDVPEAIMEGGTETGKTVACLYRLNRLAWEYPSAQIVIVRKRHVDLQPTVLQTYEQKILGGHREGGQLVGTPVKCYGGERAEWYEYPNGTRVWVGGIDNPGKTLSSERDLIYVNQAEELVVQDWETLTTRATGRAGKIPFAQVLGDMNPAGVAHWIYAREAAGSLLVLPTTHRDNPRLFDDAGQPTDAGQLTLLRLSKLTGTRRARLFEGKRASAEGLVFDEVWDENDGSVTAEAEYVPQGGMVIWAADDGYSAGSAPETRGMDARTGYYVADAHPRVFLLCQVKSDGHLDVFAESYACMKLTDEHIAETLALSYPRPEFVTYGPGAAEFRGRLFAASLMPHQQTEKVETSIQELRTWFAADANKWRRLRVHPRCRQLRAEMMSYSYEAGSNPPRVVKAFDHGPDALRYLTWTLRGMVR